jgi:hypothetical protein
VWAAQVMAGGAGHIDSAPAVITIALQSTLQCEKRPVHQALPIAFWVTVLYNADTQKSKVNSRTDALKPGPRGIVPH